MTYQIGKDFLELDNLGRKIRIEDRQVEGVTTRLLRSENWLEDRQQRRFVDIEYRLDDGGIRSQVVEDVVPSLEIDALADYARRVSQCAAENALNELVSHSKVERSGFAINVACIVLFSEQSLTLFNSLLCTNVLCGT